MYYYVVILSFMITFFYHPLSRSMLFLPNVCLSIYFPLGRLKLSKLMAYQVEGIVTNLEMADGAAVPRDGTGQDEVFSPAGRRDEKKS